MDGWMMRSGNRRLGFYLRVGEGVGQRVHVESWSRFARWSVLLR